MTSSRALHPVADVPERAIALIRVSKERDGMVSPDVQRAAIVDYATARGYEITHWIEGIDESGSRARSAWWPRLEHAIGLVEDGQADLVLAWKFSRTARHRMRWATALDRVETAGGRLESATEGIDVTTSAGRLTRGMLGELNAFQAELIGDTWREVHDHRIRAGKPATGKPKYGYAYDRDRKLHVPDPDTGPLLADLYRRYVAGESVYRLVRWLNDRQHHTTTGGPWSARALRRVLDSGFGAGKFWAKGQLRDGVHDPVIDADLWEQFLDARRDRARTTTYERSTYLLSGLVRCARCEGPMSADTGGRRGQRGEGGGPRYRCKRAAEMGPSVCRGGYASAAIVEGAVVDWLRSIADEADTASAAAYDARATRTAARVDATRLLRQVARAEEALTRLAVTNAETPLPASVYRASHGELTATLDRINAELEEAQRTARTTVASPRKAARALLRSWDTTPVDVRRFALGQMIEGVWVTTGRPQATVEVRERWRISDASPS